ncbi:hypothetical protein Tco_1327379 [Tanacetum coccineum]
MLREVPLLQLPGVRVDYCLAVGVTDIEVDDRDSTIDSDNPKRLRKKRRLLMVLSGNLDRMYIRLQRFCYRHGYYSLKIHLPLASERFVVLTDISHHSSTHVADDEVTSIVRSSMPPSSCANCLLLPQQTFQMSLLHLQPKASTGGRTAHQSCLGFEVRLRLEHELRESEAARAIRASRSSAIVEVTEAARAREAEWLKGRIQVLDGAGLSIVFKEQIKAVQDVQVKVLSDRVAELDAKHMCLQSFVNYLALWRGHSLLIDKGKRLELAAEANYMSFVTPSMSLNCSSACSIGVPHKEMRVLLTLMGLLHLEGPAAETPEAIQLQPSPKQLMLPIHRLENQVVIGETSLSFSVDVCQMLEFQMTKRMMRPPLPPNQLSNSTPWFHSLSRLRLKICMVRQGTFRVSSHGTTHCLDDHFSFQATPSHRYQKLIKMF